MPSIARGAQVGIRRMSSVVAREPHEAQETSEEPDQPEALAGREDTSAIAPEPTPRREHSWQYKKAEIVDSEECGQTSPNGYIFTCPEPGNAVQIAALLPPKSLCTGPEGIPAPPGNSQRKFFAQP